jgi:hypothetical protein
MILTIIFFIFAYTNIEGEDIIPYMLDLYIKVFYLYFKISNQDFYKCIQQIYTKIFNNIPIENIPIENITIENIPIENITIENIYKTISKDNKWDIREFIYYIYYSFR